MATISLVAAMTSLSGCGTSSETSLDLDSPEPDFDPSGEYGGPGHDWPEAPWTAGTCLFITQGHSGPSHGTLPGCPVDLDDGCELPGHTLFICPFAECKITQPCRSGAGWGNNLCVEDTTDHRWQFLGHMAFFGPGVADGVVVRRGDVVGAMGNSGYVLSSPSCAGAGTHLHFEVGSAGTLVGGDSSPPPWPVAAGDGVCSTTPSSTTPTITVQSPNGGEVLYKGTDYAVRWSSTGIATDLRIVATLANAELSPPLSTTAGPSGDLSFSPPSEWPDALNYKLCVTTVDGSVTDCSDGSFEIRSVSGEQSITVLSPNGGEQIVKGVDYVVSWTSTSVAPPLRAIIRSNGVEMSPALSTLAGTVGTLPFSPPTAWPDGANYELCVTGAGGTVFDCSDTSFSVTSSGGGAASVAVLLPNGGETFTTDISTSVAWSSSGTIGPMQIVARKGGVDLKPPISTSAPTAGAIAVAPPASWGTGSDYKICVTSQSDGTSDCSDGFFAIASPSASGCIGADLLASQAPLLQRDDGIPAAYTLGDLISPTKANDQIVFQLNFSLPAGSLRFCVDYELIGTTTVYGATAILKGATPWTDRFRAERWIAPGPKSECFDVPPMSMPFSPTQIAILRAWSSGEGFRVNAATLCELP